MKNIVFVAPFLMETTLRFVDAARGIDGAKVFGVVQRVDSIAAADAARFDDLIVIDDCWNVDQLEGAAREFERRHGKLHRIVAVLEHVQGAVARARQRLGLPGNPPEVADRFLHKNVMKAAFRQHGFPCAKDRLLHSADEGIAFAKEVGYPIIMKPPEGAGSKSTFVANNDWELRQFFQQIRMEKANPVQAEEFLRGDELTYDTVCVDGKVRFTSITRYATQVIDAVRNPWMQWWYLLPRKVDGPEFKDIHQMGPEVVKKFGMTSGFTHMEWFRRGDGSIACSEIAARPPGAHIVRCFGLIHGTDFYRVWARAVVDNAFDGPYERQYACGVVFLRGVGEGRVCGYQKAEEIRRRFSDLIVEERLPKINAPKNDSYEGDGYMILRHLETEVVENALNTIISMFRVFYY